MMAIAIYQVLGGIVGLLLYYDIVSRGVNAGFILAMIPIVSLLLVSFFAGIFYFFSGECGKFYLLSKLNFCAQMIQFGLAGIKFLYLYGFYIILGADEAANIQAVAGFKLSEYAVRLGNVDHHFFNLNLFPLIPLIMLRWAERNPEKDPAETFLTEDEPVQ